METQQSVYDIIRLDLPASLQYLNVLGACLQSILDRVEDLCQQEIVIYNIQLALHEICTNITLHAYAGQEDSSRIEIIFMLNTQENYLKIQLFDDGMPFHEERVPEPDLEQGQIHGYGLFLVRNLMDSVRYERQKNRNVWCLIKNL
jgi:serine/threonine-protein kinase RsbW